MKLGVVIPYYRTSTIREVLMKELMQELKGQLMLYGDYLEICIVEDGSKSEWLDKETKHEHISFVRLTENKGISYARNRGMDILLGLKECDYIVFVDSDDYLHYDYFKKVLTEINENPRDYYFTDFDILGNISPRTGLRDRVTGIILSKEIVKDARFDENIRIAEDVDFGNRYLRDKLIEPYYIDTIYHYNFGVDKKCLSYQAVLERFDK